jgi:hypothetical protein
MNPEQMDSIAKDIDAVTAELSKMAVLKTASPQGCAMALALAVAAHVIHDGGSKDDFMNVVHAAWTTARRRHQ